jgi:lysozyme
VSCAYLLFIPATINTVSTPANPISRPTNITDQLKRDEGLSLMPYADTVGKMTIGYGRNLTDVGISQSEANLMLANDIQNVRVSLFRNLPWIINLDDVRVGALVNMSFNMGVTGLLKFKDTLAKLQSGDYDGASLAVLDSTWARQVGARAERISSQIKNGVWM